MFPPRVAFLDGGTPQERVFLRSFRSSCSFVEEKGKSPVPGISEGVGENRFRF